MGDRGASGARGTRRGAAGTASREPAPKGGRVHLTDSAVEQLVEEIKTLIDAQNLGVGDQLPSERELCERFNSSRNTVREAMRILKTYGVVEVRPKVGAVIIDRRMDAVFDLYSFNTLELTPATFVDTQGFRRLIEVGAVDLMFQNATADDLAELRAINDAMNAATSIPRAAEQDYGFHVCLVSIIGNRQISEIYRFMKPVILRIMENGISKRKYGGENYAEHTAIVDALEARNRLAYQYEASRHLDSGLALFKEVPRAADEARPGTVPGPRPG